MASGKEGYLCHMTSVYKGRSSEGALASGDKLNGLPEEL